MEGALKDWESEETFGGELKSLLEERDLLNVEIKET